MVIHPLYTKPKLNGHKCNKEQNIPKECNKFINLAAVSCCYKNNLSPAYMLL